MEGAPKAMQEASIPLLRVSTFGTFGLAWQVAPLTAEAVWESRTSARTLFKLLLCAPGRQAPKSMLAGILWPEVDEERARESLRSAWQSSLASGLTRMRLKSWCHRQAGPIRRMQRSLCGKKQMRCCAASFSPTIRVPSGRVTGWSRSGSRGCGWRAAA